MDTVNIKKDTVVEATADLKEEDLEHGCSSFKDVHKLTEEEFMSQIICTITVLMTTPKKS